MPTPRKNRANGDGTVYQRKDGRWEAAGYVLATDGTRTRIRVYGRTRKEAFDKLTTALAASNEGIPVSTETLTVGQYLTYWLDYVAADRLRPTTHRQYTVCIAKYIIPALGSKKLARLTTRDVRTWLDRLRVTCQCCANGTDAKRHPNRYYPHRVPRCCAIGQCCGKRLAPRTLQYVHAVLGSALQHAVREERITRNVARAVQLGPIRPRRFEPLTSEEARRFLKTARDDRLHALWELALRTGMRRGELLGLTWSDLDTRARTLDIRRTLQHAPAGGGTALYPTKTLASERRIALPDACITALAQHHRAQQAERRAAGADWHESGLIFTTPDGSPLLPTSVTAHFRVLLGHAGVRRTRFHDLRHTCATLLLEQGVELVVIKNLLGHAHISITAEIYAHVRLRLQRDAIEALGNALTDPDDDGPEDDEPPACGITVR
ncbi:tyrosine-type recombinase/integrase [Streptacidiphilus sp. MAP5-3]|uniref:tyrosine-type recombinase/integrase n=1 Tax=unclassified Streptacidiphilus TaxID=2643834 RepID=UPI00351711BE